MLLRNTIANYVGQVYNMACSIIVAPLYLLYVPPEEFGLIGLFLILNSTIYLLSSGLVPVLARQAAIFKVKGKAHADEFFNLLRGIEWLSVVLAVVTLAVCLIGADWFLNQWLKSDKLNQDVGIYSLQIMGFILATRWGISVYSSGLAGLERQVTLNQINVLFTTLRWPGSLALMASGLFGIMDFFTYQAIISLLELALTAALFYRAIPVSPVRRRADTGDRIAAPEERVVFMTTIRNNLSFTLGTFYTVMAWAMLTQYDKILASRSMSLELYGYFAFAILVANGADRIAQPIGQAILPRLTIYVNEGDDGRANALYSQATQFMAIASLSVAVIFGFFAQPVIFAVSGNSAMADGGAVFLAWFGLGSGILTLSSLLLILQNAYGHIRVHILASTLSMVVQVPLITFIALHVQAYWIGVAWAAMRLLAFVISAPIVHIKFSGIPLSRWLLRDIGLPLLGAVFAGLACLAADRLMLQGDLKRWIVVAKVGVYSACVITTAFAFSDEGRRMIARLMARRVHV
jgi:O-antigen/teichoic acid export membrane protein